MKIISKPKPPASEYAPLALNLMIGCSYGCRYCFAPRTLHRSKSRFFNQPEPKSNALDRLAHDAAKLAGDDREILLSTVTDPYQPNEKKTRMTRRAIKILMKNDLRFTVLTKAGMRAARDFDLLMDHGKNASFGTSLAWTKEKDAQHWEPNAASIKDRINAIEYAHESGIITWVSLEPVIKTDQAIELVERLHPIVDYWKIGKISNNRELERKEQWWLFYLGVTGLLDELGGDYYVKESLERCWTKTLRQSRK